MFWGKDKSDGDKEEVPHTREEARPESLKSQIPRQKLSRDLQKLVDREDDYYDELYGQYSIDSTNTKYRYAAYVNRVRTILLSAHRYVAYTSDVGESFRPVAHPYLVRSAYAISWTYILGDVGHEGYKAYLRNRRAVIPLGEAYKDATDLKANDVVLGMATGNIAGPLSSSSASRNGSEGGDKLDPLVPWATTKIPLIDDYRMVMAKRAVFQSIASMGLPAFTIHSVVRYSGRALKNSSNTLIRTWGPIGLGLSVVPMLPYLFDEPVEHAVEWSFATLCRAIEGPQAVAPSPPARELPADQTTPLSKVLALQEQKKRHEGGASDYNADRQGEKAKSNGGVSSWLGFGKKEKDE